MGELNEKKDKDGRITETLPNGYVIVMFLLSKIIFADEQIQPDFMLTFLSMFFLCCSRTNCFMQPDDLTLESGYSTYQERYLGCLTRQHLEAMGGCVGLSVVLIGSIFIAGLLRNISGTYSNIFEQNPSSPPKKKK